jgi:hypothetical protein
LNDGEVAGLQVGNAVGIRFEVVQDGDMGDSEFLGDFGGIDSPCEVGGFGATIADDAWNSEARRQHGWGVISKKLAQHGVQARIAGTRVTLLAKER